MLPRGMVYLGTRLLWNGLWSRHVACMVYPRSCLSTKWAPKLPRGTICPEWRGLWCHHITLRSTTRKTDLVLPYAKWALVPPRGTVWLRSRRLGVHQNQDLSIFGCQQFCEMFLACMIWKWSFLHEGFHCCKYRFHVLLVMIIIVISIYKIIGDVRNITYSTALLRYQ
jgi:hypothetical protein